MRKIPYSVDARDLFTPGLATDFFDPEYGPVPTDEGLCAEMSRLAYLRHEDPGGQPHLEAFLLRARFDLGPTMNVDGVQGFVASGPSPRGDRVTVVAFRGTEPQEPRDAQYDVRFRPVTWAGGGKVHGGFAEAFDAVRAPFLAALLGTPGRLLITGHSLGAGIATLAASLVPAVRRASTLLCTFGSPRVGDPAFAASLAGITHLRYAGACDLVSWVPPVVPFLPYRHHGTLRCIDRAGTVHEFRDGESAHDQAGPLRAQNCAQQSPVEIFFTLLARAVPIHELTDHTPINYMSAVWGIRA